jgi:hypothetical protein
MPRQSSRYRSKPTDPPVQQRVVFARYTFGWLAVEVSALGWRFQFGNAGIATHVTAWQRLPAGEINQHIDQIIRQYETQYGVERIA